jgi:hypothetical protein
MNAVVIFIFGVLHCLASQLLGASAANPTGKIKNI